MQGNDQVFGQFLVDAGLITRAQLEALRQVEDKPLSRSLIDIGIMGEDEVRRATAHALGVPFVVIDPHDISLDALILIPEPLSRKHSVVAFAANEACVQVAVLDLSDLEALAPLEAAAHFGHRRVVPHLTTREVMKHALVKYQKHLKEKFGELLSDGRHVAEALIGHALYSRAGGAHVDLSTHGALVRYQIGHALHEAFALPQQAGRALVEQIKALAKLLPVARPQTGKFNLEKDGEVVHVHVSTTPTTQGERMHMRLARHSQGARGHTLEALGLHGQNLEALRAQLARRRGLVAVSGSTGAGKTTLLYTLLDLLQHPGTAVATVEEHVAYRLPHAAQSEVGAVSAAAALRATLRQHPDILMVGDVRDHEAAALCAAAAARGVFVLAGTSDESLLPLLRQDSAGHAQADALVRVALVRRLATNQFAHKSPLSRGESAQLEQVADFRKVYDALKDEQIIASDVAWKEVAFARPTPSTGHTDGYEGHIGLQEVVAPGYETLNIVEDALFKAAQGQTSVEEAIRIAGE
ncbi:MAG TPA: ATPase, T2SS/T4P/T4SS family [Candidatus Paceibacterota bacterium]